MTPASDTPTPRTTCVHWGVVFALILAGVLLVRGAEQGPPQPQAAAAPATVHEPEPEASASAPTRPVETVKPMAASPPVRISIPAIRLDAPLTPISLGDEGFIVPPPPQEENLAGWLRSSPTPGESGTSVIAGHVDNEQGPSVFYHLGALKKGHHIRVTREDTSTAVFEIYGIEVFETASFPAQRVYTDTGRPEVRVLTCGGSYDEETGYSANVVVFARMVSNA